MSGRHWLSLQLSLLTTMRERANGYMKSPTYQTVIVVIGVAVELESMRAFFEQSRAAQSNTTTPESQTKVFKRVDLFAFETK